MLVNNAARGMRFVNERFMTDPRPFWEADPAAWRMVIETNVPVPIVRVVVPVMPEEEAEIVTIPPFFPWAIPVERIEARFGFEDFHETPLRFVATLPSLNVPVAVNLIKVPFAILGVAGVIAIDTRWAVVTVRPVVPLFSPKVAFIVVPPFATLFAIPCALIVAAPGFEDVHTTVDVTS